MIVSLSIFALTVFVVSYALSKRLSALDSGELAAYIVLIAWASLFMGLGLSRVHF